MPSRRWPLGRGYQELHAPSAIAATLTATAIAAATLTTAAQPASAEPAGALAAAAIAAATLAPTSLTAALPALLCPQDRRVGGAVHLGWLQGVQRVRHPCSP